jgi:hypothetical protein
MFEYLKMSKVQVRIRIKNGTDPEHWSMMMAVAANKLFNCFNVLLYFVL